MSRIKNGGLGRAFRGVTVLVLVISDVIGSGFLPVVGSGPFLQPEIKEALPGWMSMTEVGTSNLVSYPRIPHYVIGSVSLAVQNASDIAARHGLVPLAFGNPLSGEARVMTRRILRQASIEIERNERPFCMIFGGETTVTLNGSGNGGRCQEMAMSATPRMRRLQDCALLVAGTDGSDGPTSAAGGLIDASTCESATLSWRESMRGHDSNAFLGSADALISTGPTGSNVNDLALFVST